MTTRPELNVKKNSVHLIALFSTSAETHQCSFMYLLEALATDIFDYYKGLSRSKVEAEYR